MEEKPLADTKITIIPAIDIIDGKCVRLTHGDYSRKTVYRESPLETARSFEEAGIERLHLVDLDGAKAGKVKNWEVLETIASNTKLKIDFGGGIKTLDDVKKVFDSGAAYATVGSIAVKNENEFDSWLTEFPADKFLLGADVRNGKITINGWEVQTDIDVFDFIQRYMDKGIRQIFCTDVSKDGALLGSSVELYSEITRKFPGLYFIASGGVHNIEEISDLAALGCSAVIIGKALYEGKISLNDLKPFL
jgi:phosphoribosylformimino-5-aminoimidazole carboxamide ribotide isomerase